MNPKPSKSSLICALLIAVGLWLGAGGPARAAEDDGTPVALSSLPAAVQKSIRTQAAEGKLGEITRTLEDGEARYAFEVTHQGRSRSLVFDGIRVGNPV